MAHIEELLAPSGNLVPDLEETHKTKLVYNDALDTSTIQNILLISCKVVESQQFFDSASSNTFPIIYSPNSAKNELNELLRNKFKNGIKRIGFAFHDPLNGDEYFLDDKHFFGENDFIENQTTFSENVSFLTNLITEFKVENLEFLACNSLQYSNWKKYYELLNKMTNVTCGASNDNTGNIQYGSDWVMENTNENVKDIYFTSSIDNYTSSLAVFVSDYLFYSTDASNNATITGNNYTDASWNLDIPSTVINNSITYTVTKIGNSAFSNKSNLLTVKIPNSVTTLGDSVFINCGNLTSITIGSGLITVGRGVIQGCVKLTSITIDANNQNYSDISGIVFDKSQTILVLYPQGKLDTSYTIPKKVTNIGSQAFFFASNLVSVIIPDSVTIIGPEAFYSCSKLVSIIIPDSVTILDYAAFQDCLGLTSVVIGAVKVVLGAFYNCQNLVSVTISNSVTYIDIAVFSNCIKLKSVYFMGNIPTIITGNNFTITADTAYIKSDATLLDINAVAGTTVTDYLKPTFFTNVVIGTTPTIQPWYPSGIQSTLGDSSFALVDPSSNSLGSFTYKSLNTNVATISGKIVTVVGSGTCDIQALQDACGNYFSGSVKAGTSPTIQPWNTTGIQKAIADASFSLVNPLSNSSGLFTYTSSNTSVATIVGNIVTMVGLGSSIITALQVASGIYSSNSVNTTLTVQLEAPVSDICFRKGTPIRTDQGLIQIDKINPDYHTIRNKKIVAITKTVTQEKYLVCFEKDSLGPNMPSQKTFISANHKIFNKGTMIKAKEFVGKYENIYKVKYSGEVLYNVLMEEYDRIVVNNLICESLHPENTIAQLYTILQGFNLEEQQEIIKQYNEFTLKNKICGSTSSKR